MRPICARVVISFTPCVRSLTLSCWFGRAAGAGAGADADAGAVCPSVRRSVCRTMRQMQESMLQLQHDSSDRILALETALTSHMKAVDEEFQQISAEIVNIKKKR